MSDGAAQGNPRLPPGSLSLDPALAVCRLQYTFGAQGVAGVGSFPLLASLRKRKNDMRRGKNMNREPITTDGGRDGPFEPPPARIRTCVVNAYGSYIGCVASKRAHGYGCLVSGLGSQRWINDLNRCQFVHVR